MRVLGGAPTPLIWLYQTGTTLFGPMVYGRVARKLRQSGVEETRVGEKMGYPTLPRPAGRLIWFHGASVGESLSVLTLIRHLAARDPEAEFLITSGTATSAKIIAGRLPSKTRHQFAPLDIPGAVERFYDHWQPNAGVFVESELWPNLLLHGRKTRVPLALINARLSEKSVQGWKRWPKTARQILNGFTLMISQNRRAADNLVTMGADPSRVRVGVNLKAASDPLPIDAALRQEIAEAIGERPIWIASSTHSGEEETVLAAHAALLANHPELCLILIPRHPERGDNVSDLVQKHGFRAARRSQGEGPDDTTQVFLADTLGETGTWYAMSRMVFLGGSLKEIGGHNPFEPAQAGAAVATGPHVANFSETFTPMIQSGAAVTVETTDDLAGCMSGWLNAPASLDHASNAALAFAANRQDALTAVVDTLVAALNLEASPT